MNNGYKIFLNKEEFNKKNFNLKVTKVKKTSYGFIIHLFKNYITLYYKYVTIYPDGSAKILTKVNKNYCAPYQVTTYEDKKGEKITLKQFQKLKK